MSIQKQDFNFRASAFAEERQTRQVLASSWRKTQKMEQTQQHTDAREGEGDDAVLGRIALNFKPMKGFPGAQKKKAKKKNRKKSRSTILIFVHLTHSRVIVGNLYEKKTFNAGKDGERRKKMSEISAAGTYSSSIR